jgi:hypothetical protein
MLKKKLLIGAAFTALTMLEAQQASASSTNMDLGSDWDNDIDVSLEWNVDVDKYLDINGDIFITGNIDADALAQATINDTQVIDGNSVTFEDYQNAFAPSDTFFEPDVGASSATEAIYNNRVDAANSTLSSAAGNIGLNMAAGDYNMQENVAVLATANPVLGISTGAPGNLTVSGGAEAGNFSLQNLYNNVFNTSDNASAAAGTFEVENTNIDNTVSIGSGSLNGADGNIGVNGAAGAFNIQKNAMAIAVVNGGNLAEANSGVTQDIESNASVHEDTVNTVTIGSTLVGASGNIGVNLAAGVGNLQLNSLTIATTNPNPTTSTTAVTPVGGGGGPGPV